MKTESHTHIFDLPTATKDDVKNGVKDDVVLTPMSLNTDFIEAKNLRVTNPTGKGVLTKEESGLLSWSPASDNNIPILDAYDLSAGLTSNAGIMNPQDFKRAVQSIVTRMLVEKGL